jgi:hypothetical protein
MLKRRDRKGGDTDDKIDDFSNNED